MASHAERRKTLAIALAAILAAPAAAQNVLKWDAWKVWGTPPLSYTIDQQKIRSYPVCIGNDCYLKASGWEQTFVVLRPGRYQLEIAGSAAARAWVPMSVILDQDQLFREPIFGRCGITAVCFLQAGTHRVQLSSGMTWERWEPIEWKQPVLREVGDGPYVDLKLIDGGGDFPDLWLNTNANILAVSAGLGSPVPLPGVAGALELDPATMVIISYSSSGQIREHFDTAISRLHFGTVYFQAATWNRLGPHARL